MPFAVSTIITGGLAATLAQAEKEAERFIVIIDVLGPQALSLRG